MEIGIINKSNHNFPEYKTDGASGMDIKAYLSEPISISPGQSRSIPTGLFFEIPAGLEIQVRPRSGLALKHNITVLNSPGTIDSDYRGELLIILINHSQNAFKISNGDRIAQIVLAKVEKIIWQEKDLLSNTKRGSGGFGSTGKL
ncbi:MAG: dUTP diphosphatase [Flavobacteriales bacterium]|nr:dUTP diphosphatase [Flavobacteriales bacterium]|tara:strand:- start:11271 stop:11705 length:435 start_codon:yes stop_codon:yes gene_type:complete